MALSTAFIIMLQVDDLISAKSPPRAPSLFDLTAPSLTQESAEWLISWDEIELGRRIGAGSYGEVFRAQWRHTDVAVKRLQQPSESSGGVSHCCFPQMPSDALITSSVYIPPSRRQGSANSSRRLLCLYTGPQDLGSEELWADDHSISQVLEEKVMST